MPQIKNAFFSLVLAFIFSSVSTAAETQGFQAPSEFKTYTLENDAGKKVVLFAIAHVAESGYYAKLQTEIEALAKQYPAHMVLEEFQTCSSSVWEIEDINNLTQEQLPHRQPNTKWLRRYLSYHSYYVLLEKAPPQAYERMISEGSLVEKKCTPDVNGVLRSPFYVKMLEDQCQFAADKGLECQVEDFSLSENVNVINADYEFDKLPVGWQMAVTYATLWSKMSFEEKQKYAVSHGGATAIRTLVNAAANHVSKTYREQIVANEALAQLEEKDLVIIPWGSSHKRAFVRLLGNAGFTLVEQ